MMHSSLAGILKSFKSLVQTEREFVLATIVETQGSTYRKAGARMLITRSGSYCGLLGGGCFESDLLEHAYKVFETRKPAELLYDMRAPEDLVWGLGLGCNGAVCIWLEYLSADNDYSPLPMFESALQSHSPSVLITTLHQGSTNATPVHYLFGDSDKIPVEYSPPAVLIDRAIITLESGQPHLIDMEMDQLSAKVFYTRINVPVQLLVIGGGPDSVPVIRLANQLGWKVTIIDYRENYSDPAKFPDAHQVIRATPEQLLERINIHNFSAVVLMTHKYEYDLRYLRQLTDPALLYIGLLGPTARRNELLRAAGEELEMLWNDRCFGPVGLDIGGELPEEIALALIAQIQAVVNNRKGGHLACFNKQPVQSSSLGSLWTVVLAAGGSTRFGALKQLLEYNGKSLLNRTVQLACGVVKNQVVVVHGPKPTKCQREISSYDVTNLVNEEWQQGLSGSLAMAIESLPADCAAVLVLLCDQPLIEKSHVDQLIQAWSLQPEKIIASNYAETIGVPAIIPRTFFQQLLKLTGDVGAKMILQRFSSEVISIPIPEAEYDIDTQADFAKLLFRKQN